MTKQQEQSLLSRAYNLQDNEDKLRFPKYPSCCNHCSHCGSLVCNVALGMCSQPKGLNSCDLGLVICLYATREENEGRLKAI